MKFFDPHVTVFVPDLHHLAEVLRVLHQSACSVTLLGSISTCHEGLNTSYAEMDDRRTATPVTKAYKYECDQSINHVPKKRPIGYAHMNRHANTQVHCFRIGSHGTHGGRYQGSVRVGDDTFMSVAAGL